MTSRNRSAVKTGVACFATVAAAAGAAGASSASASASSTAKAPQLPVNAKAHGLTPAGAAVMGWSNKKTSTATGTAATLSSMAGTKKVMARLAGTSVTSPFATGNPALGIDVSSYTGVVDWASFKKQGVSFAYAKATEGDHYTNPFFAGQKAGAAKAGITLGAYHFANPNRGSAKAQVDRLYSVAGKWKPGQLVDAVDVEYNPYGTNPCYGLSQNGMTQWLLDFQNRYYEKNDRYPMIYSSTSWWKTCVGDGVGQPWVAGKSPLWMASYSSTPGVLPVNYAGMRIWQNSAQPTYDTNIYNGTPAMMRVFASMGRSSN